MSKATTLLILALLLFSTLSYAARTGPVFSQPDAAVTVTSSQHTGVVEGNGEEEKCGEGVGEEECLMRRTLAAHLDYIYTQKKNP